MDCPFFSLRPNSRKSGIFVIGVPNVRFTIFLRATTSGTLKQSSANNFPSWLFSRKGHPEWGALFYVHVLIPASNVVRDKYREGTI